MIRDQVDQCWLIPSFPPALYFESAVASGFGMTVDGFTLILIRSEIIRLLHEKVSIGFWERGIAEAGVPPNV